MGNILNYIKNRSAQIGKSLTLSQKVAMSLVLIVTLTFFIVIVKWAVQPDFTVLFTGLDPADAQEIVDELRAGNTAYQLTDGGRSIMVPQKDVYELRMRFAARDLPNTGGIGYEIFDKKDIGVSEFVQKINFRRALEGELARTIKSMPEISGARVHIVFPQERLFKEDQKEPTASIFLSMHGVSRLRENQIQGIARLVSSSVEGLAPENVTIVDSHGHILSKSYGQSAELTGLSDTQLNIQRQVETHIEGKVQSMLDEVLGRGNSIVRIKADLDFKRIETTNEKYDPDNVAVLSEEVHEESSNDSVNAAGNRLERTVTNYQLTKSIEHIVNSVGDVKRLSVAVMVNGTYTTQTNDAGEEVKQYVPRTEEEMTSLVALVRNAVGLDEKRGDQIEIQNLEFDTSFANEEKEYFKDVTSKERIYNLAERVAIGLVVIILFLILRSQFKKAKNSLLQLDGYTQTRTNSISATNRQTAHMLQENELLNTSLENTKKEQELTSLINEKPEMAARLVRYWLMEG